MQYKIRIYNESEITDISLEAGKTLSIGSGEDDYKVFADDVSENQIVIRTDRDGCFVSENGAEERAVQGETIVVISVKAKVAALLYTPNCTYDQRVTLTEDAPVTIGRNDDCTIVFKESAVSRKHAKITLTGGAACVEDLGSANGTYVCGKRVIHAELKEYDIISVGKYDIFYANRELKTVCYQPGERAERISHTETAEKAPYPYFKRSPRLKLEVAHEKIDVQSPPAIGSAPQINWLSLLLTPAMMLVAGLVGSMISPYMLVFAVGSPIVAVVNYMLQKNNHQKETVSRENLYRSYLREMQEKIEASYKKQLEALTAADMETAACLDMAKQRQSTLWARRPQDDDFMSVRIGHGAVMPAIEVSLPAQALTLHEDALANEGRKLADSNRAIKNAPITCSIRKYGLVGVTGDRRYSIGLVKNMIIQMAANHSYEETRIALVFPASEKREWDWVRWLPHVYDDTQGFRTIACDVFGVSELCRRLETILKERASDHQSGGYEKPRAPIPYYLFVVADMEAVEDQNVMNYILDCDGLGAGAVFLCESRSMLPKECKEIIELSGDHGVLYNAESAGNRIEFTCDAVPSEFYDSFARAIAPIRIEEKLKATKLPRCVTFLDGYNVKTPYNINVTEKWAAGQTFRSMAVPIGVRANGESFLFDIHEKKHGPHGLVAGMTGSGKSEMVQSWILSMALHFSPSDISFVLIDFKGTGLILPFEKMPHLAGTISNIDKNIHRNLVALENELSRRQVLFDQYGVQNITDYLKLYHRGKAEEPLSFLFIVIDEFAEFKAQFPEFMTVIDRIFAIGRTLGVFNILLTQKPSGVVSDKMNANTRFRWCLKVASSSDSRDMLHHPDAAKITVPGRAFVQVGEDEVFEEIQSFWSGAPYNPSKKDKTTAVPKISGVTLSGKRISYEEIERTLGIRSDEKEIDTVVSFLNRYVEKNNVPRARKIWTEKLPARVSLNALLDSGFDGTGWPAGEGELTPVIGLVDDPRRQAQYPVVLNLSGEGHAGVFGAPSTGKTTLLYTLILSMVRRYSPDNVNIYIMDFNTWGMGIFRDFPHIGGVANDNEEEKVDKLMKLVDRELASRREKFAAAGVGSLKAYRDSSGKKMPYIVLIVDNFAPVFQLYPVAESFFLNLSRQGGSYGIYIVATANTPMGLTYKINQNIKNGVALQMTDRGDYASIVGKIDGLEPENTAGRGLVKGAPPLEFQTALPAEGNTDAERAAAIRKLAAEMNAAWKGRRAEPIPIMPDIVRYGSIFTGNIAIGLDTDDITPVGFDFTPAHYIPISGTPGSGKSNLLKVILKQFKESWQGAELVAYDANSGLESIRRTVNHYYDEPDTFDAYMAGVVTELQRRKELYAKLGADESFYPIVIGIDGLRACIEVVNDKTVTRLVQIVKLGKGLNVYLLATEDAAELGKLCGMGEMLSMLLIESKTAFLLGGSAKKHPMFESNLPYDLAESAVGEFEGYILKDEHARRVKFMCER